MVSPSTIWPYSATVNVTVSDNVSLSLSVAATLVAPSSEPAVVSVTSVSIAPAVSRTV